jgi:(2Fe-2S) ferredoxin
VSSAQRQVLVCQHKTCRKDGAARVLQTLQGQQTSAIAVVSSGCLGNCGNGPTVLVLPEQTLFSRVQSPDLPAIMSRPCDDNFTPQQPLAPPPTSPSASSSASEGRSRRVAIVILGLAILLLLVSLGWGVYSLV